LFILALPLAIGNPLGRVRHPLEVLVRDLLILPNRINRPHCNARLTHELPFTDRLDQRNHVLTIKGRGGIDDDGILILRPRLVFLPANDDLRWCGV
jgi:hypothetical protein